MHKWIVRIAVPVLAVSLLTACKNQSATNTEQTVNIKDVVPVTVLSSTQGNNAALTAPGAYLIKSQAQLQALGASLAKDAHLQTNFNDADLILVALGRQPTAGYWVNVTQIYRAGDELVVQGVANRPAKNAKVAQTVTYPYVAVRIPKTNATSVHLDITSVQGQKMSSATHMSHHHAAPTR